MPTTSHRNSDAIWHICLIFIVFSIQAMVPTVVSADADPVNTPIGDVFCTVGLWSVGNLGKGIATLTTIIAGIGALLSKISWGAVLVLGINISVIFGASAIVEALDVDAPSGCDTNVAAGPSDNDINDPGPMMPALQFR